MLVKRDEIDEDKWNRFVESSPQGYIYHYTWYLDAVFEDWQAVIIKNNEQWHAVMPLTVKKKWGVRYALQPIFTQFLGVLYRPQESKLEKQLADKKDWTEAIIHEIPKLKVFHYNFSPNFDYPLPFYWQKYTLHTRYNYILDLNTSMEHLHQNLNSKMRQTIKKGIENELIISQESDINLIGSHVDKSFLNEKMYAVMKKLFEQAQKRNRATLLIVKDKQGKVLTGGVFMQYKNESWINLYGSFKPNEDTEKRPAGFMVWKAIELAHKNGFKVFDFEGSMIEGVERFFRKFGARPVPYISVYRNTLPFKFK